MKLESSATIYQLIIHRLIAETSQRAIINSNVRHGARLPKTLAVTMTTSNVKVQISVILR